MTLIEQNHKLKQEIQAIKNRYNSCYTEFKNMKNHSDTIIKKELEIKTKAMTKTIETKDTLINEQEIKIKVLESEISRLTSIMRNDSTNSGIPTSKTAIGGKKNIPNSREITGKSIGGQIGHKKHKLNKFDDEQINEIADHNSENCLSCGSKNISPLNTSVDKDETDYEVKVIKRRHKFNNYKCNECNKDFHAPIPNNLKMENQYGYNLQALSICLVNEVYTPFNKVSKLITGITENEINMSEGYIAKLQPKAYSYLDNFLKDAKNHLLKSEVIGWDDGVIKIETKDAYLRVYCNGKLALFRTHETKHNDTIIDDGILNNLPSDAFVMHDHYKGNYGDDYDYKNVECLAHLLRRLEKNGQDTSHKWQSKLKALLRETNKDRNKLISDDIENFSEAYLREMEKSFSEILDSANKELKVDYENQFWDKEETLIKDLLRYRKNYLMWAYHFKLPSTNNLCERNLRPSKSKMKISGQFRNINYASYYAGIRSYIETCKINGKNIIDATVRLMNGNPYTLDELLKFDAEK